MTRPVITLTRALLVALGLCAVGLQAVALLQGIGLTFPVTGLAVFDDEAGDGLPFVLLVLTVVIAGLACVEVVLHGTWRLLTLVARSTVFTRASFRHVHRIIGALLVATALLWILGAVLAPTEIAPGAVLLVGIAGLAVLGVALIVLVIRALLAQAVAMKSERAEVI
ncbi:DUF2975 domain-containing protein [Brevibacterium litoralis]|uniref:DUF2975 domain-containing protein n=1 Tax=Brevibacterium litoralis TaxID=3138935 RepID=UPI0032EED013